MANVLLSLQPQVATLGLQFGEVRATNAEHDRQSSVENQWYRQIVDFDRVAEIAGSTGGASLRMRR